MTTKFPAQIARRVAAGESWLTVLIEMRGLSIEQLASLADVNVGDLARMADGKLEPTPGQLTRIVRALHIDLKDVEHFRHPWTPR